jgi:nucleoid-associated protein YgaU
MQHLYTVVAGDTLRSIAQRFYGDENQWPRIFNANRDQISNPDVIQVGWVLTIPGFRPYAVKAGDTLRSIAQGFYGDENQWPRIFNANRDQIDDPNLIFPGQILRIPTDELYTVVAGDTLRSIAQQFYGDENQWPRIFDENRDQIDDPNVISVGQVLLIPLG